MTGVAAVAFDLDGVLIDSEQTWDAARRAVVSDTGGQWSATATRDMMGMSAPEWSRYMHDKLAVSLDPAEINRLVVQRVLDSDARALPMLPGAVDAVRRLAAVWPLAVASSSNRVVIDAALRAMHLDHTFRVIVSSEEVPHGKPAPDVYLAAAERLHVDPARTVAVEDSGNGIRAAIAAGMHVIAVPNREFPPAATVLDTASVVLESLRDLTPGVVESAASRLAAIAADERPSRPQDAR